MATFPSMWRALLVEDEVMVAMHVEDVLGELGCQVVGLATRLSDALTLARDHQFDFAVLDINLAGDMSFPVADVLRERKIPFMFVSGYTSGGVLEGYRHELRLRKPFRKADMARAIEQLVGGVLRVSSVDLPAASTGQH